MSETGENKVLSLEEGMALLGAEEAEEIGEVSLDPIGLHVLAAMIGQRLASRGGRPTDTSWEMYRKIPMKTETWRQLNKLADAFGKEKVRVAPGQLAAIALEQGLSTLRHEKRENTVAAVRKIRFASYKFDGETEEEASVLAGAISNERFW
jgi:hypothetical protein